MIMMIIRNEFKNKQYLKSEENMKYLIKVVCYISECYMGKWKIIYIAHFETIAEKFFITLYKAITSQQQFWYIFYAFHR